MTVTQPWLLEVATEDGIGFHSSRHVTREEAVEQRTRVRDEWRRRCWGQDPQLAHISGKAIYSCITLVAPTSGSPEPPRGAS